MRSRAHCRRRTQRCATYRRWRTGTCQPSSRPCGTQNAAPAVKLAFQFLILSAARTSEVLGVQWAEIDHQAETWTVPGERIKSGREHRVPLAPTAMAVLKEAATLADGGPVVFPGRRQGKPLSNMALLMVLRRLGRTDITAHGFRSSFRDWAAERTHFPRAVAEAALAHVIPGKVEAAYLRSNLFDQRRALMNAWAAFVTPKPTGAVVRRRAGAGMTKRRKRTGTASRGQWRVHEVAYSAFGCLNCIQCLALYGEGGPVSS